MFYIVHLRIETSRNLFPLAKISKLTIFLPSTIIPLRELNGYHTSKQSKKKIQFQRGKRKNGDQIKLFCRCLESESKHYEP